GYTVQRLVGQVRMRMFEATKRGSALEDLAYTDALTGLGNRRAWAAWLPAAGALLARASEGGRRELRPTDVLARYGGEEFAAVLPACALADAHVVVERVRAATPLGQTVSAGIAEWNRAEDAAALV